MFAKKGKAKYTVIKLRSVRRRKVQLFSLLGTSAADKWTTGGLTTLIGLGMTFVMLTLLICSIHLLRLILKGLEKFIPDFKKKLSGLFRKKDKAENVTAEIVEETPAENAVDEETMAVIENSVKRYVANSATDGKPHDRIKILSVKEVTND